MKEIFSKIKCFYVKEFLTIKEIWQKPLLISFVLVTVEQIQLLSLIIMDVKYFENEPYLHDVVNPIISYFRFYSLFGESLELKIGFVFLGFSIISIFFISLIMLIWNTKIQIKQKMYMQQITLELTEKKMKLGMETGLKSFISVIMQIYQEILRIPIQYSHFSIVSIYVTDTNQTQNLLLSIGFGISIVSIFLQIALSLLIDFHSFEFRMKNQDILGKFNSKRIHIIFLLQFLIIITQGFSVTKIIVQWIGIIYTLLSLQMNYSHSIFQELNISKFVTTVVGLSFVYQISVILYEQLNYLTIMRLEYLLLFIMPLVYNILSIMNERLQILVTSINDKNLDKIIRILYHMFQKQIKLKKQQRILQPNESLQIYTFITVHLRNCQMNRERKIQKQIKLKHRCFCEDFFQLKEIVTFESISQMKLFAKELIAQTLEDDIIENNNINNTLLYIYFLIQIKKVPTQAIYEVIRLSQTQKENSYKIDAVIYKLKFDALQEFSLLVERHDLRNQKYVFKRVYQYEESLQVIKLNLVTLVRELKDWFGMILTSVINIDELNKQGSIIIQNMKQLEQQLQIAFSINPLSNECDTIYNIFIKYVLYNKVRPKIYRREGQLVTAFIQSVEKNIFDPGSCVIQITLLQPRGNIIRYTRSFQQAIGFQDEEIQDQNINKCMPQIIANDHDLYLNNFVERGRINVVRSEIRVILCKTKSQFLVPINTRLRIETSPTEFGATALITPVNLTYGYIILNQKGQIEEMTQNMFDEIFKFIGAKLHQVKGLDCLFFIPELAKIWQELFVGDVEKLDRRMETHIIIPNLIGRQGIQSNRQFKTITKIQLQKNLMNQFETQPHENATFHVSIHIISLLTINLNLIILEIPEFKLQSQNKLTSKQLIQIKQRTSQLMQQPLFLNHSDIQLKDHNLICDMEQDILQEEERMIYDLKNQLATVNITTSAQQNRPLLVEEQQNFIEERNIDQQEESDNQEQVESGGVEKTMKRQSNLKNIQIMNLGNTGSVGSRQSGNPQGSLKRQIKDCLSNETTITKTNLLTMLLFYILILSTYLLNFFLIWNDFNTIKNYQNYENIPFELSYFYNEFIISEYYKSENDFDFKFLQNISIEVFHHQMIKIDDLINTLPQITIIQNTTFWGRTIKILEQMVMIQKQEWNISYSNYLDNCDLNRQLLEIINSNNSSLDVTNLEIYLLLEIFIMISLIIWFIYESWIINRMKMKTFKLFCTFSKECIQEMFVTFNSLHGQLNSNKFKKNETDEELFETTMIRQFQRQSTHQIMDKNLRVGKQISKSNINSISVIFIIFLIVLTLVCSFNYIGCYLLHSLNIKTIRQFYGEKQLFLQTNNELAQSYSQIAVFTNISFIDEMSNYQNLTISRLNKLRNQLSLYQPERNQQIYNILTDSVCSLFIFTNVHSGYQDYDNLFNYSICNEKQTLQNGLSVIFQELYLFQLSYQQALTQTTLNIYIQFYTVEKQLERLYTQLGLITIINYLTEMIQKTIQTTIIVNGIILGITIIFQIICVLIMKLTIQNLRTEYNKSKQLLTLFPYEKLMENAYVASFIQLDAKFNK